MIGHNRAALCNTPSNTEYPTGLGILSRLDREWKLTKTGFTGNFSIDIKLNSCIDLAALNTANFRILLDDDGNFNNASVLSSGEGLTFLVNGNTLTINGLSSNIPLGTSYFTLATLNAPLTIKLANFVTKVENNKKVILSWDAFSTNGISSLAIQRSIDATNWKTIQNLNENSSYLNNAIHFTKNDNEPIIGKSFYRIKATEPGGKIYYSDVKSVSIDKSSGEYFAYPNPAKNVLYVNIKQEELNEIRVFNVAGKDLTNKISVSNSNSLVRMDVSKLPSGQYFILIKDHKISFVK